MIKKYKQAVCLTCGERFGGGNTRVVGIKNFCSEACKEWSDSNRRAYTHPPIDDAWYPEKNEEEEHYESS